MCQYHIFVLLSYNRRNFWYKYKDILSIPHTITDNRWWSLWMSISEMRFSKMKKYFPDDNNGNNNGDNNYDNDNTTQIAKFMGPTWGPPGPYRPQMVPMLAPWTLLSGNVITNMLTNVLFSACPSGCASCDNAGLCTSCVFGYALVSSNPGPCTGELILWVILPLIPCQTITIDALSLFKSRQITAVRFVWYYWQWPILLRKSTKVD